MKYGKGDPTKRRGAWVFGGIERGEGGRAFMKVCPDNKRTKVALWPIIEENIAKGSAIYSDGLLTYRKLHEIGYTHRWVNHKENYVDPEDRTLHTNKIEGFWGCWKKWLPSSGPYNLEEYLYAYLWFHQKKMEGEDVFWCLVNLVAENNSVDVLKEALKAKPDMMGVDEDEANLGMIDDGLNDDYDDDNNDDDDQNELACPLCDAQFGSQNEFEAHFENECAERVGLVCPFCDRDINDQEELVIHIDNDH